MPWHTNESVLLVVSASPFLTGKLILIIQQGENAELFTSGSLVLAK